MHCFLLHRMLLRFLIENKEIKWMCTWMIKAVLAIDLLTDDIFVFSKASRRLKEAILNLSVASSVDDEEEAEPASKKEYWRKEKACAAGAEVGEGYSVAKGRGSG